MRVILEGTYDDIYKNVSGSDEGFNTDVKNDKHNFETMQSYYSLCMNESTINSLGPTPIYEDIANIENKLFPINDTLVTLSNTNATDSLTQTITLLQRHQIMALTTLFTNADEKNPDINVISLSQPPLSFPSKEYYSKVESVQVLRTGLNDLLYKVLGGYSNGTSDSNIRASESNRTGFQRWSEDKIKSSVDRFIDFEAKLSNIYPSP
jgi:predicted metalloendopeptidase